MIDKLINMAKQNFDLAFLMAEKNNLVPQLFIKLRNKHIITKDELKKYMETTFKTDMYKLDICYNLECLSLYDYIESIDLTNNPKLKSILIQNNSLNTLNIKYNFNLEYLDVANCKISKLDVSNNNRLKELFCSHNLLETLELCEEGLLELQCDGNELSMLNLKNNNLEALSIESNKIQSIDVGRCTNLYDLYIDNNPIESINLNNNLKLELLHCGITNIKELTINSTNIKYISCKDSTIQNIYLKKEVKNIVSIKKDDSTKIIFI